MIIIALAGNCGAGKTTLANKFAKEYNFVHLSFADELKKIVSLSSPPLSSPCSLRSKEQGSEDKEEGKDRKCLEKTAKIIRNNNDTYFVDIIEKQLKHPKIIISDLRFNVEYKMLSKYNTTFIYLERPSYIYPPEYEISSFIGNCYICSDYYNFPPKLRINFPYKKYNIHPVFNNIVPDNAGRKTIRLLLFECIKNISFSSLYEENGIKYINHNENEYYYNMITEYYSEKERIHSKIFNKESPYEYWQKKQNYILTYDDPREHIYQKKYDVTNFKVSLAKCIYNYFNCKKVFDPFAGWGDRMIGASAANVEEYVCVDKNSGLRLIYHKINRELCDNKYHINILDIIDFPFYNFEDNYFDFAIISPPFYNYEIYNNVGKIDLDINSWIQWLIDICIKILRICKKVGLYLQDTTFKYTEKCLEGLKKYHIDTIYITRLLPKIYKVNFKGEHTLKLYIFQI